jgi:peptidoglycan hydrolase CwlO-like protein
MGDRLMNDIMVSVGKTALHSFFHNHTEHAVLANKVEALERREDDYKEIVRKVDALSNNFYELKGEFHSCNDKIDKIENRFEEWNGTITALRQYLDEQGRLKPTV